MSSVTSFPLSVMKVAAGNIAGNTSYLFPSLLFLFFLPFTHRPKSKCKRGARQLLAQSSDALPETSAAAPLDPAEIRRGVLPPAEPSSPRQPH
jgi:hypothetical protein